MTQHEKQLAAGLIWVPCPDADTPMEWGLDPVTLEHRANRWVDHDLNVQVSFRPEWYEDAAVEEPAYHVCEVCGRATVGECGHWGG